LPFGRLNNISLKWKLLIPFLFLALAGATALFVVSFRFQASLIHVNEEKRLRNHYQFFLQELEAKTNMAMSLAYLVAKNPEVAEAFAGRDRRRLMELLQPAYQSLHDIFGVRQFHFHVPPAISFLRLHAPEQHGEDMAPYRPTINQAMKTGAATGGLEQGVFGFGIRSVVPVFQQGTQVGTFEIGFSFKEPLLREFKESYGLDLTIYLPGNGDAQEPRVFASTLEHPQLSRPLFDKAFEEGQTVLYTDRLDNRDMAVIAGPVRDFSSRIVAVVEISADRSPTLALLRRYGAIATVIGLAGLILSISFVWFISVVFTRRIEQVVQAADEIAAGHRERRISVQSADELGIMARAINEMLTSLEESRKQVKDYAENLELMVEQRTRLLTESEETYRTLVENVPLIVYFVMPDGFTSYLNRFVEQVLGVTALELSGHHELWAEYLHPNDRARVVTDFDACLSAGEAFLAEYRMVRKDGGIVYVIDHAIPVFDHGSFARLDGIVVDVTTRRELEQKILQAEELQTLREVSARLAHEIRNPLTSVGGLTRRLMKSFDDDDLRKQKAELIVSEVKRLENILKMMTAYVEPKAIQLRPCDLNAVVGKAVHTVQSECTSESFAVEFRGDPGLPGMELDGDLIEKVLVNLMQNAYFRMKETGKMDVTLDKKDAYARITIAYKVPYIADDDIEHFFFPFLADHPLPQGKSDAAIVEVPMTRVIVHKHGGI
jgi:PAS domain S-box-containing protein